jgi:hypothetical protein
VTRAGFQYLRKIDFEWVDMGYSFLFEQANQIWGRWSGKLKDHRLEGDGLALYIQTAGGALHHVLTTARPEAGSGATPHRSN